jgi:hypothetical protein
MRSFCIHRELVHKYLVLPYAVMDVVAKSFPLVCNISCHVSCLSSHSTGRYAWIVMQILCENDEIPDDTDGDMLLSNAPCIVKIHSALCMASVFCN